jgi:hypothetical protein
MTKTEDAMRFFAENTVSALGKTAAAALAAGLLAVCPVRGWAEMAVSYPATSPNFQSPVSWGPTSGTTSGTTGRTTSGTTAGTTGKSAGASTSASTSASTGGETGGSAGRSDGTAEQASWNVTPTLAGGARASISGVNPDLGFAFAADGYYTPYGDDMKGGGFSLLLEGELLGARFTMSFFDGDTSVGGYDASTSMTYFSVDFYLRQALAENLYIYGGVGMSKLEYEYEYSYRTGFYHGHHKWYEYTKHVSADADSDPIFSCYAGLRWRFANPLYVFAEYRYDADADLEMSNDVKTTMEGGGRAVFGGGVMF